MKYLILLNFVFVAHVSFANLDSYLEEVKQTNSGFKSSIEKMKSLEKKKVESTLPFEVQIFSEFEWLEDKGPRLNPAFQGSSREQTSLSLGFTKKTRFGLDAELSYNSIREDYAGRPTQFFALNDYYTNNLTLSLEQSIIKNAFGAQSRNEEKALNLEYEAEHLMSEREAVEVLVTAEKAYWDLAFNEEIVETLGESVKRAKAILDYNQKRFDRNVVENDEVLQAKAGYLLRQLDYEEAKDNYTQVVKNFRSMIETSQKITPPLEIPSYSEALNYQIPKMTKKSANYLSRLRQMKAAKARLKALKESAKPDLKVYASLVTGDIQANYADANQGAFTTDSPVSTVGIRFSTPLAFGKINTLFEAYSEEASAAEMSLARLAVDERVEKEKLIKRFKDLQERLKLSQDLEMAQKKKLENERKFQRRGRSTTFQVLTFEQDYLNSQVSGLRLRLQLMNIYADFKNFQRLRL